MICKLAAFIDKISIVVEKILNVNHDAYRRRTAKEVSMAVVFSHKNYFLEEKYDGKKMFKNRQ